MSDVTRILSQIEQGDAETGDELLTYDNFGRYGLAFSPDGHRLLSAQPQGVKMFDATPLPEKP